MPGRPRDCTPGRRSGVDTARVSGGGLFVARMRTQQLIERRRARCAAPGGVGLVRESRISKRSGRVAPSTPTSSGRGMLVEMRVEILFAACVAARGGKTKGTPAGPRPAAN